MSTSKSYQKLRIFAASPSDVASERAKLETVVASLKPTADYLGLTLEVVDWRAVVPDAGRPQQIIFDQLKPTSWDIFVGILWHRFGTPPGGTDPQTQKDYLSGTEEEFRVAYRLWKQFGKPRIVMYRCTRAIPLDADFAQAQRVKDFFKEIQDPQSEFRVLTQSFDTTESFEKLLLDNLQKLLLEYGEQSKTPITPEVAQILATPIPNNLPRRAPFFGRAKEMDVVMRALSPADRTWGILVDGIGGIGKSALAVEAAHRAQDAGAFDAFVFITAKQNILAPSGIREQTPAARTLDDFLNETARVLGQIGIAKLSSDEKRRALLDVLRTMRALLIYDNLETLDNESQLALADLLRELPQGCKAIVTSRRRGGEGAVWLRLERLEWEAARDLIQHEMQRSAPLTYKMQRAGEVRWKELYNETGGSPLALTRVLGLMRVRVTLNFDGAMEMLHGKSGDADLQKFIFQESRKELGESDLATLFALSFFVPSASFEAVMEVAKLSRTVLETSLERLSALSIVDELAGGARYRLNELTRGFVREQLLTDGQISSAMRMSYIYYWIGYSWQFGDYYKNGLETYAQLEAEWSNLNEMASMLWDMAVAKKDTIGDKNAAENFIELAKTLRKFLWYSGRWDECIQFSTRAYHLARALSKWKAAGSSAYAVAWIHFNRGQTDAADAWTKRCEQSWANGSSRRDQAIVTRMRGLIAQQREQYDEANRIFLEALTICRKLGSDEDIAIGLNSLGELARERKQYSTAGQYFIRALQRDTKSGNKEGKVIRFCNLGALALDCEQWAEARKWFEQAWPLAQELGRIQSIADAQHGLARVHEAERHSDLALPLAQEALAIYERLLHRDLAEVREMVKRLSADKKAD